jgi:hypothetical protein
MTDFGSIGRERSTPNRTLLNVWSGTRVNTQSIPSYSISYKVPLLRANIGVLNQPELFMAPIDNNLTSAKIVEVVSRSDIPQKLQVRLYDRATGKLITKKMAEDNGVIEFGHLAPGVSYTLVVLDPENMYNAAVLDLRKPSN